MEAINNILDDEWQLDDEVKMYLLQTAVLGKYIAMIGMIFAVLTTVKSGIGIAKSMSVLKAYYFNGFMGAMTIVVTLLAGAIYFSVSLFTWRFAVNLRTALEGSDQALFNSAWYNFKMSYKILGILFIIYIVMMFILFLL